MEYRAIGDLCSITKGSTGIMKAVPGPYPLVTTGPDRKSSSEYEFDDDAVCIPLVSSTGHGHKSLNYIHFQSGKFALGTILAAVIPKDKSVLSAEYLQRYLFFFKEQLVVSSMKGAANVSLAVRDIAKIQVPVPSMEHQKKFIEIFSKAEDGKLRLLHENQNQATYLTKLRQAILQEAIEGKLTADLPCRQAGWRNKNFRNFSGKIVPKQREKYFAYVLECDDESLYKGFSQDLFSRIDRHLEGRGAEWTQKHKPVSLIHFEEFETEKEAVERERYFKSGSGREWLNEIREQRKPDYDAEALLEKIQAEKEKLIKEGKIKKQKPLAPIKAEEVPFELPKGWVWCQLSQILANTKYALKAGPFGSSLTKSEYKKSGYKVYGQEQVISQDPFCGNYFIDNQKYEQLKSCAISPGDILISLVGTIGKILILPEDVKPGVINPRLIKITLHSSIFKNYFTMLYSSGCIQSQLKENASGQTMDVISIKILSKVMFPLPPFAEEQAIVERVEKLLSMVDELEKQVSEQKEQSEQLMQAVLREAFEGKS